MATYYISGSGSDANSGLSTSAPIKTINKLNTLLNPGDEARFRSGETYYGNLKNDTGTPSRKTIIGQYGGSGKYTISGYKKVIPASWVLHSGHIYKVAINSAITFTGNIYDLDVNVGHLLINNSLIKGDKKLLLAQLTENFQFFSDATYLYIFLEDNPALYDIQFATKERIIRMPAGREVYDAIITGGGGHGFALFGGNNKVINTDIINIGGSLLGDNVTRLGNGIEIYGGASNIEIFGGEIKNVYDVGFTCQGETATDFRNISFRGVKIKDCSQSFEFWVRSQSPGGAVGGFFDVLLEDNECFAAGGWGGDIRTDNYNRVHMLFYSIMTPQVDITFRNNTFYQSKDGLYYSSQSEFPPFKAYDNTIILNDGQSIRFNDPKTVEQANEFVAQSGKEIGSKFFNSKPSAGSLVDILRNVVALIGSLRGQITGVRRNLSLIKSRVEQMDVGVAASINNTITGNTVTGTGSDAGYWAKLCTINLSNSRNNIDFSNILAFTTQAELPQTAIVSFTGKQTTSTEPTSVVQLSASVLSISNQLGTTPYLTTGGFKIVSSGFGNDFEIWVRKNTTYGRVTVKEVSRSVYDFGVVNYIKDAVWQSGEPALAYNATSCSANKDNLLAISADYNVKLSDFGTNGQLTIFAAAFSTPVTINCLPAADMRGLTLNVIKRDTTSNAVTIRGNGSELINEENTSVLKVKNSSATLKSNGIQFYNLQQPYIKIDNGATPYTKATINTTYPNAKEGFKVISDTAGFTYTKKDDSSTGNWSVRPSSQLT